MKLSVIVPVYNRPDEVNELLGSITTSTKFDIEILVVDDGSTQDSANIVDRYRASLPVYYYYKENSGPALSRNLGAEKATGDYLIFFDSDCIIPSEYFHNLYAELATNPVDAFGGPDRSHPDFTPVQKAISYAMTSFFTTGGIRGGKRKVERFLPRSFNMGISREAFNSVGGFFNLRFGEDLDFSLRLLKNGYSTSFIPGCWVYHKRRTDFRKFFRQVFNSGIARINIYFRHPDSLKIVHAFPSAFCIGILFLVILSFLHIAFLAPLVIYIAGIFIDSMLKEQSGKVGLLSVVASFIQLIGYGSGFLKAVWQRIILKRGEFRAYSKNFYD